MFGLGLNKLILLAIIIAIVWYGWKYVDRVNRVRRAINEEMLRRRGGGKAAPELPAEDLIKCTVCGAYVPGVRATSCGRADCPWPA